MALKKGQFRQKRSDTKMGTIEKKYNRDFGVRSDKKLAGIFLSQHSSPDREVSQKA